MDCKICCFKTDELIVDNNVYHKCLSCGYTFMLPEYSSSEEKERYMLHNNTLESEGYVSMFERFILKCVLPFYDNGYVLDFGSGPVPVLATLLKRHGFSVSIYDIHFAHDESVFDKKYNIITCTEVFEHLSNPLFEISKLNDALLPGGILAVMTGFIPDDFVNWRYRKDFTHIGFFTPKAMKFIADKFGFEIVFINDKNLCVFKKL